MNNAGKKLEIFVIVSIIAFIGIIYAFKQSAIPNPNLAQDQTPDDTITPNTGLSVKPDPAAQLPGQQVPTTTITYAGMDGKNAMELLIAGHTVEVKDTDAGELVTSIDGISPAGNNYWAMYVNDQFIPTGTSYATKTGDTIRWQIDAHVDTTK